MRCTWTHENLPVVVFNIPCIFYCKQRVTHLRTFTSLSWFLIVILPYAGIIYHHTRGKFSSLKNKKEDWANKIDTRILRCKYWRFHGKGKRDDPPNPGIGMPTERFIPPIL